MDRHDRKQLLHRPAIRHALEQRKIAEVRIRKHGVQAFQLFRKVVEILGELLNLAADRPVEAFRQAALLERQIAEAEQVQRRIERLLRIVKTLEQVLVS